MSRYTKPYLTVPDQLALLESRGMGVADRQKASEYLSRVGYYRLSAYWVPFRESQIAPDGSVQLLDSFKPGTSFQTVLDLYAFDKALRLQLLDALERIEISIKTHLALRLGSLHPWAHREPSLLSGRFTAIDAARRDSRHSDWLGRLDEKEARSKEEFAVHFRRKYAASRMPIWIAVELLDFGPLSHLLAGMRTRDVVVVAQNHGVPRPELLTSWIRSLSGVRNVCAHHSRLWNKPIVDQPRLPVRGEIRDLDHLVLSPYGNKRIYAACAIARHLLRAVNPRTMWGSRLRNHLKAFPEADHISPKVMGFPEDWECLPLWN